jgi:hypothetical protein
MMRLLPSIGLAVLLACAGPSPQSQDARELRIHHEALVLDGHNDLPLVMVEFGFDFGMDGNEKTTGAPGPTSPSPGSLGGRKAIASEPVRT